MANIVGKVWGDTSVLIQNSLTELRCVGGAVGYVAKTNATSVIHVPGSRRKSGIRPVRCRPDNTRSFVDHVVQRAAGRTQRIVRVAVAAQHGQLLQSSFVVIRMVGEEREVDLGVDIGLFKEWQQLADGRVLPGIPGMPEGQAGMDVVVIVKCESQLLQIIFALSSSRRFTSLLHCWQQQRNQDGDDRNDDQ